LLAALLRKMRLLWCYEGLTLSIANLPLFKPIVKKTLSKNHAVLTLLPDGICTMRRAVCESEARSVLLGMEKQRSNA
jgi:hypothetical protein